MTILPPKSGVSVPVDRVAAVLAEVRALTRDRVLVGVPAEKADREPDPEEKGEPINNAAIAYIHDNGAPDANIPARPFMISGVETAKERIAKRMRSGAKKALQGDKDAAHGTLTAVGLIAQAAIRARIQDGDFKPLAPATLADRRRRRRTGEKPLIDTGQLRNAINYVIRKRDT